MKHELEKIVVNEEYDSEKHGSPEFWRKKRAEAEENFRQMAALARARGMVFDDEAI